MLLKPHEVEWLQSKFHSIRRLIITVCRWTIKRCDPIVIATIATVLATMALAFVALLQIKEMAAEQRPWIYAEFERVRPDVRRFGSTMIEFSFKLSMTNIGHRPAVNVVVSSAVWPSIARTVAEREARVTKVCREQESAFAGIGQTLFPNQTAKPWAGTKVFMQSSALIVEGRPLKMWSPYVIACVLYRDTEGKPHHTPYSFFVGTPNSIVPGVFLIPTDIDALQNIDLGVLPDNSYLGNPD